MSLLLLASFGWQSVAGAASAQQRRQQGPIVAEAENAPPMKYVPAQERARIDAEDDSKDRLKLTLELAEARLARAERLTSNSEHVSSSAELGIYQALVEDIVRHLQGAGQPSANGKVPNKYRDLFKRLELVLRAHAPRVETIRRATPSEEAGNVRAVYEFTREARAAALNSFYGETVLREDQAPPRKTASTAGEGGKDKAPTPDNK